MRHNLDSFDMQFDRTEEEDQFGGIFGPKFNPIRKKSGGGIKINFNPVPPVKVGGKTVKVNFKPVLKAGGTAVKGVTGLVAKGGKAIGKVPVVGKPLAAVYNMQVGNQFKFADDIVKGKRIDRAVYDGFKREIKDTTTVAPYVQTVISVVPGVGPGVSGAIGAGVALLKGQTIDEALVEGVKDSLPGGPAARAALEAGMALAKGEKGGKIVADAAMTTMGLTDEEKTILRTGFTAINNVAQGKKPGPAVMASLDRAVELIDDPDLKKGLQIGIALGEGEKLQNIALKEAPYVMDKLGVEGAAIVSDNKFYRSGVDAILKGRGGKGMAEEMAKELAKGAYNEYAPDEVKGYMKGIGLMSHKLNPSALKGALQSIPKSQKVGFQMGIGAVVGGNEVGWKKGMSAKKGFGFALSKAMKGRSRRPQRQKLGGTFASMKERMVDAATEMDEKIKDEERKKRGFFKRVGRTVSKADEGRFFRRRVGKKPKGERILEEKAPKRKKGRKMRRKPTESDEILAYAAAGDPEIAAGIHEGEKLSWWEELLDWFEDLFD